MADRKPVHVTQEQLEEQKQYMRDVLALPQRPESYYVVTYGCQMNAHDSEKLAGMLREMGMKEAPDREQADFVIFNTCCVRDNAERRALGNVTWLKEIRKRNPRLVIAVCGCMIQQPGMAEKILKQYRFIDLAFGTANLHKLPELLHRALNSDRAVVEVENEDVIAEDLPVKRLRKDAFVRSADETSFVVEPAEDELNIVRMKQFYFKPMTREEAVMQMNLLEHNFFAFRDEDNGGTFAVVYKRNDGGYGLIDDIP